MLIISKWPEVNESSTLIESYGEDVVFFGGGGGIVLGYDDIIYFSVKIAVRKSFFLQFRLRIFFEKAF